MSVDPAVAARPPRRRATETAAVAPLDPSVLVPVALLWLGTALVLALSLFRTSGILSLALDDPYIHMATAKNLAAHGVWGVTPYEFSSATSSLLWPLLLAAAFRVGLIGSTVPFVLNLLCGSAVVAFVHQHLRRLGASGRVAAPLAICVALWVPIVPLVFTGQEHLLHTLLALAFATEVAGALAADAGPTRRSLLLCCLYAGLLTAVRYEGLFMVAVACLLALARRRLVFGVLLGLSSLVAPALFGLVSVANGAFLLPNSVLVKGGTPSLTTLGGIVQFLGYGLYLRTIATPHVLTLVILCGLALHVALSRGWSYLRYLLLLTIGSIALHMQFAAVGWFFRYEAYLVGLGTFAVAAVAVSAAPRFRLRLDSRALVDSLGAVLVAAVLVAPFFHRGLVALSLTPAATWSIYAQQYQMGLFLHDFYEGETVGANDIGAIDYLADIRCVDLWGLASHDVAAARMRGDFDTARVSQLAREKNMGIAVVYDSWLQRLGGVPSDWTKVGEWTTRGGVVNGSDTVSFYAVDPAKAPRLAQSLRAFSPRLPAGVEPRVLYPA